jgi:hypothetical protein
MSHKQKNTSASRIRLALDEIGWNASPKEIIARLKAGGIEVTPQQVSNEKAKRGKQAVPLDPNDLPVSFLKKLRALVDEVGSTDLVRHALDELDELSVPPAGRRAPVGFGRGAWPPNALQEHGQEPARPVTRKPTPPQEDEQEEEE